MQIPSMDGEFVGMSLYFFVIDFLKTIYQMDDAHPTIGRHQDLRKVFLRHELDVDLFEENER